MEVGYDIDIDHVHSLGYIKQQAPRIPILDIHGILQLSGSERIFLFMTQLPGKTFCKDTDYEDVVTSLGLSLEMRDYCDPVNHGLCRQLSGIIKRIVSG